MEKTILLSLSRKELKNIILETLLEANEERNYTSPSSEERMNQKEAAEYLGISQVTLISWKKKKKVPVEQIPGSNKVWYYKSQLKKVLQQNPTLLQPSRK
ncbi:hypothetical protein [Reichenbachiella ulvae]|uniref:Helix-turn-helix domain-containing protein n=1 Tax=Reichenbachiella ulvae TaxID=2980104 RepID=A0ABT3D092_9BACT|nr:hypothetical protein [Reichenbachiella ulvae]MCV9389160.1 hypothetical protein [Reichenbachiella ulvae]